MCVIVLKPNNVTLKLKHLKKMWDSNSHGAGFAIPLGNGTTHISKGYMTLESLWNALQPVMDKTLIIHFRLATHGTNCERMTHPFILSSDLEECVSINTETTKPVLAHNGIISKFGNKLNSDTVEFILQIASKIDDTHALKYVLGETDSKYALIKDDKIHLIGQFHDFKGMRVSNLYFSYSYSTGFSSSKNCTLNTSSRTPSTLCTNEDRPKILNQTDLLWDDCYDYRLTNDERFTGIDLDNLSEEQIIAINDADALGLPFNETLTTQEEQDFFDSYGYYFSEVVTPL